MADARVGGSVVMQFTADQMRRKAKALALVERPETADMLQQGADAVEVLEKLATANPYLVPVIEALKKTKD